MEEGSQINLEGALTLRKNDTTFKGHHLEKLHNWYSYIEGFSGNLVRYYLKKFNIDSDSHVLDPFSGCGTTVVESVLFSTNVTGIDINPFLSFVTRVKSKLEIDTTALRTEIRSFKQFYENASLEIEIRKYISDIYLEKDYFSIDILNKIAVIKMFIESIDNPDIKDIFRLAMASILVGISNMRRGPDLARRKDRQEDFPVYEVFVKKLLQISTDIDFFIGRSYGSAEVITGDAKDPTLFEDNRYDLVVTSPPYLNGTNYSRNTKLELWILDFLKVDTIKKLREKSVTAGINDAFSHKSVTPVSSEVDNLVTKLEQVAYDQRIPIMVSTYFSDINRVLSNIRKSLKTDARCVWVTGDSVFSDIYIPTDLITMSIARENNLSIEDSFKARSRKSRSGKTLRETVITMKAI